MLWMHERTERFLMRAAFVALCVCPTAGVLAWGAWNARPGRIQAAERRLAERFGVDVAMEDLAYPSPGATEISGLSITDPETGETLASCPRVHVQQDGELVRIDIDQIELVSTAAPAAADWLARRLRGPRGESIRLHIGKLAIATAEASDPITLHALDGELTQTSDGGQAWLRFDTGDAPAEPIAEAAVQTALAASAARPQIRVLRDRRAPQPYTAIEVDTAGVALPCRLAWELLPVAAALGDDCHFQGRFTLWPTDKGPTADLAGSFSSVELARLIGEELDQPIAGLAEFRFEHAKVVDGRLVEAAGSLYAGAGQIDRPLAQAAANWLNMGYLTNQQDFPPPGPLAFSELGVGFELNAEGLRLRGACEGAPDKVVLAGPQVRLEILDPSRAVPPANLAAIFAGAGPEARLSPAVVKLANRLPLAAQTPPNQP